MTEPHPVRALPEPRQRRSEALAEDLAWLLETGETGPGILRRLNIRLDTLQRSLRRNGRHDLVAALNDRMAAATAA